MDYNTRLPPRKRLLAGMKSQSCTAGAHEQAMQPLMFHSLELHNRVTEVLEFSKFSTEGFVEASESVALAAERAAVVARATATEKAEAAMRAVAFARSVLEVVSYKREGDSPVTNRGAAVGVFYDRTGSCVDDEEMARRLHRAMNSSPRNKVSKKHAEVVKMKGVDGEVLNCGDLDEHEACIVNFGIDNAGSSGKENKGLLAKPRTSCSGKIGSGSQAVLPVGKKGKLKRKKMLLSQFCGRDSEDAKVAQNKVSEVKNDAGNSCRNSNNVPEGNESLWKRKKLKLSEFYLEGDMLPAKRLKEGAAVASDL